MAKQKDCKELMIAHRPAQAIIDTTRREADRLEAALKRETTVGDCAKLREAAVTVYNVLEKLRPFSLDLGDVGRMREFSHFVCLAKNRLDAALAAPPRNCDNLPNADRAELEYRAFCERLGIDSSIYGAMAWMLANDTAKLGGDTK